MAHFRRTSESGRADVPSEVVWLWSGLGCMLLGMDYTSPPLFRVRPESDCDVESSRACYRSCSVVNELSPRCRSCQSVNKIPKSKIHNPTSPLLLFANLHTLKRLSADNPSRPPPPFLFLTIIFCVFGYLLLSFLLILNIYLSHTLRTSELKQWKLIQTLRLCGPMHLQK